MSTPLHMLTPPVERLCEALQALHFIPGTPEAESIEADRDHLLHILEAKIRVESSRNLDAPVVVLVAGGTNVGKSTLFNRLVGQEVARPDETAGATRAPSILVSESRADLATSQEYFRGFEVSPLQRTEELNLEYPVPRAFTTTASEDLSGFLFIDSPDVDSTVIENAGVSWNLLSIADTVLFVTTDQKYLDRRPMAFLEQALGLEKEIVVVFNKMQSEAMLETIRADFTRMLRGRFGSEAVDRLDTVSVPYVDQGKLPEEAFGSLHQRIFRGGDQEQRKWPPFAGSCTQAMRRAQALGETHQDQWREVERAQNDFDELLRGARREHEQYVRRIATEEFYELDVAIHAVLRELRVPYVDDVIDRIRDGVGAAARFVRRRLLKLDQNREEPESRLLRRREGHKKRVLSLASRLATDFVQRLREEQERHPVAASAYTSLQQVVPLEIGELERLHSQGHQAVDHFATHVIDDVRQWLEDHPSRKAWIVALRLAIRAGVGVAAILLTGGIGFEDLLVGPLSAAVVGQLTPPAFAKRFQDRLVEIYREIFDQVFEVGVQGVMEKAFVPLSGRGGAEAGAVYKMSIEKMHVALKQAGIKAS